MALTSAIFNSLSRPIPHQVNNKQFTAYTTQMRLSDCARLRSFLQPQIPKLSSRAETRLATLGNNDRLQPLDLGLPIRPRILQAHGA